MRFMMLMLPNIDADYGTPDAEMVGQMGKYNEQLSAAGALLALDGLHPPASGARVSFSGGKGTITDGPFSEAKEFVGGYWLIDVKSQEEAVEWAARCPALDGDIIEVRRVFEMEEFPEDVQAAVQPLDLPGA